MVSVITEVGIISLATIGTTCLLQMVVSCFKGTRESRCKKVSCCCYSCENDVLTADEIRELEATERNTQANNEENN
tara:strand:+ start:1515 stop:1742 length:228 start_codon:yes stop_codon:yes gene_type:complete